MLGLSWIQKNWTIANQSDLNLYKWKNVIKRRKTSKDTTSKIWKQKDFFFFVIDDMEGDNKEYLKRIWLYRHFNKILMAFDLA